MNIDAPNIKKQCSRVTDCYGLFALAKEKEYDITDLLFQEETISDFDFGLIGFRGVFFKGVTFSNCSFEKCGFYDCVFENCDFSGSDFRESYWSRCEIKDSKGVGATMPRAILKHTFFYQSNMTYANFNESKWEHCIAEKSNFDHTHIADSSLKQVSLKEVSFIEGDFFKTPLKDLDFSDCQVGAWTLSADCRELKGSAFNSFQCVELAKRFGIIIKE